MVRHLRVPSAGAVLGLPWASRPWTDRLTDGRMYARTEGAALLRTTRIRLLNSADWCRLELFLVFCGLLVASRSSDQ